MSTSMPSFSRALLPLRRWLVPDERGLGWMPLYTLGYLLFLLSPALFSLGGIRATSSGRLDPAYWGLTALSVLVFLPLYFGAFRQRADQADRAARPDGFQGAGKRACPADLDDVVHAEATRVLSNHFLPFRRCGVVHHLMGS